MVAERQDEAAMGAHGVNSRRNKSTTRASCTDLGDYEDLHVLSSEIFRQVHVGRGEGAFSPPFLTFTLSLRGFFDDLCIPV